ncbi:MAG: hypothetical protein QM808_04930 [Steroidobacteraceae bacterium]
MRSVKSIWWCVALLLSCLAAQSANAPSLVGKWISETDTQRVSYEFAKDGSVFWMYQAGTYWSGIKAKYRLNAQTQPMQLDLYAFSDPDMADTTLLGIIEFTAPDKFKLVMAREARPTEFTEQSFEFERAK